MTAKLFKFPAALLGLSVAMSVGSGHCQARSTVVRRRHPRRAARMPGPKEKGFGKAAKDQ